MQTDAFRFDGDAALALEVHRIEHLFVHLALRERPGHFEQAIGERGFAVVDVRDDAEVSNELRVHFFFLPVFSVTGRSLIRLLGFPDGPAAFERATHAAQKPCRINIQFATIRRPRQLAHPSHAKTKAR